MRKFDANKLAVIREAFRISRLAERSIGATRKEAELLAAAVCSGDEDAFFTALKAIAERQQEQARAEVRAAAAKPKSLRQMGIGERVDLFHQVGVDRYINLAAQG